MIKIKIVILGHIPYSIDKNKILKWKSNLFEILKPINSVTINGNSDGKSWEFTDDNIEKQLPLRDEADILLAVTNIPLQSNYFVRRFSDNRVCMTFDTIVEILIKKNIPLENLILRTLYSNSLVYIRFGNRIPLMSENIKFTHDETRGCIFDMNGSKTNIVYSLNGLKICDLCVKSLKSISDCKIEDEKSIKFKKSFQK